MQKLQQEFVLENGSLDLSQDALERYVLRILIQMIKSSYFKCSSCSLCSGLVIVVRFLAPDCGTSGWTRTW